MCATFVMYRTRRDFLGKDRKRRSAHNGMEVLRQACVGAKKQNHQNIIKIIPTKERRQKKKTKSFFFKVKIVQNKIIKKIIKTVTHVSKQIIYFKVKVVPTHLFEDGPYILLFDAERYLLSSVAPVSYTHLTLPTICSV